MGLVRFGVPKEEIDYLQKSRKLDTFVEGGTYKGDTAKNMSSQFDKVYTIEKSEEMFNIAKNNLENIPSITLLKGDTREHLQHILEKNDNILFWLDAHWSGEGTYGEEDECPLITELDIIFKHTEKNYLILIDDARLFLAPPPLPHNISKWPSLTDILRVLPKEWELLEFEDVLYLYPRTIDKEFKLFMQSITTDRWKEYARKNQSGLIKSIKNIVNNLLQSKST